MLEEKYSGFESLSPKKARKPKLATSVASVPSWALGLRMGLRPVDHTRGGGGAGGRSAPPSLNFATLTGQRGGEAVVTVTRYVWAGTKCQAALSLLGFSIIRWRGVGTITLSISEMRKLRFGDRTGEWGRWDFKSGLTDLKAHLCPFVLQSHDAGYTGRPYPLGDGGLVGQEAKQPHGSCPAL